MISTNNPGLVMLIACGAYDEPRVIPNSALTAPTIASTNLEQLAHQLGINYYPQLACAPRNYPQYALLKYKHRLGIYQLASPNHYLQLIEHDFFTFNLASAPLKFRLKNTSLRKESLARAIGMHPNQAPQIVDATAGLGRDSLMLASLGFKIRALERNQLIYALLDDALQRARHDPDLGPILTNISLIPADFNQWISVTSSVDVIYLDPMFPARNQTAAPTKDVRMLQLILSSIAPTKIKPENNPSESRILQQALAHANHRVIIKRHRQAPYFAAIKPHFKLMGNSTRFDIYVPTIKPLALR